jgi:hypothetical protein
MKPLSERKKKERTWVQAYINELLDQTLLEIHSTSFICINSLNYSIKLGVDLLFLLATENILINPGRYYLVTVEFKGW